MGIIMTVWTRQSQSHIPQTNVTISNHNYDRLEQSGAEYNDPLRFIRPISKTNDVYKFWLSVALLEYYWREIRKIHSRMSVIRARDLNLAREI